MINFTYSLHNQFYRYGTMSSLEKFSSEEAETYNSSEEEADENDDGMNDAFQTTFTVFKLLFFLYI